MKTNPVKVDIYNADICLYIYIYIYIRHHEDDIPDIFIVRQINSCYPSLSHKTFRSGYVTVGFLSYFREYQIKLPWTS